METKTTFSKIKTKNKILRVKSMNSKLNEINFIKVKLDAENEIDEEDIHIENPFNF